MLTKHDEALLDGLLLVLDQEGLGAHQINMYTPTDDVWYGKVTYGKAGESMVAGDRWKPLYCRDDGNGSGSLFYFYDASYQDSYNDNYKPVALLQESGTFSACDTITLAIGDGYLRNDSWPSSDSQVGMAIYANPGSSYITFTQPSSPGDHIKQLGTLFSQESGDVFEISFRYTDWTL